MYRDVPRSIIYNNQALEKIKTSATVECINKMAVYSEGIEQNL